MPQKDWNGVFLEKKQEVLAHFLFPQSNGLTSVVAFPFGNWPIGCSLESWKVRRCWFFGFITASFLGFPAWPSANAGRGHEACGAARVVPDISPPPTLGELFTKYGSPPSDAREAGGVPNRKDCDWGEVPKPGMRIGSAPPSASGLCICSRYTTFKKDCKLLYCSWSNIVCTLDKLFLHFSHQNLAQINHHGHVQGWFTYC